MFTSTLTKAKKYIQARVDAHRRNKMLEKLKRIEAKLGLVRADLLQAKKEFERVQKQLDCKSKSKSNSKRAVGARPSSTVTSMQEYNIKRIERTNDLLKTINKADEMIKQIRLNTVIGEMKTQFAQLRMMHITAETLVNTLVN